MPSTDAVRMARLGGVLSSVSRTGILCALMGGAAHTPGELARHLGLAASSVSEHVGVLLDAGLVRVEAQGRHRYVRLADAPTAALLEQIGAMASLDDRPPLPRVPTALAFARSCYGHLAGTLGVAVHDGLLTNGTLRPLADGRMDVTPEGARRLARAGVVPPRSAPAAGSAAPCRPCLDWSERRHHLAGGPADALLTALLHQGWLLRRPDRPRALVLGTGGRRQIATTLEIEVP